MTTNIYYMIEIYFQNNQSNCFELHNILMKYDYDWKEEIYDNDFTFVQIDIEQKSLIELLKELDNRFYIAYIVSNDEYNNKSPSLIFANDYYLDDMSFKINLTSEESELKKLAENRY